MATSWLVCLRDDGFAVPVRWWDGARYVDTSPSRAGWSDGETATCCSFDNLQLEGRLASKGKPSSVSLLSLSPESCQQNNATDDDNGKEYRCLPYRLGGSCLQLAKFILSSSLFFFFSSEYSKVSLCHHRMNHRFVKYKVINSASCVSSVAQRCHNMPFRQISILYTKRKI